MVLCRWGCKTKASERKAWEEDRLHHITMPDLTHKALQFHQSSSMLHTTTSGSGADSRGGIWSRSYTDDVDFSQLHKFWSELSSAARHELLRIDKQALFEQVRKNLYCSRCNGLLLEGFSQIILLGKNLQGGALCHSNCTIGCNNHIPERGGKVTIMSMQDDVRDPSVHPWGGLAATRDSMLTLLDCFLDEQPLEVLQNVFDSARARERERELLYPDACGGGGRGWISQGNGNSGSGRGHSLKETCALHTARLSCDALVDFWSALGEETRRSLLRMKEEDFIERLMFRFDSKRFCRDCRRNVLREFKEMKELKRTRKEPRCTRWFCTADTAFRYEVSDTSVQVDWKECFEGDVGSIYQHFEWGLGSAEGKSDILGFEDVGLSEGARVDGLDLGNVPACYITLRAWKRDGRCTEVSVKAHGLKEQLCVHRRLIVGDGYVTITKGETIKRFFERAEEAEEEEDDDGMDKDGSDPDSEGSRLQKHAKSPELARDFLLDAATVIFKEQVEKAFREGTARQNAHTMFVCLALSLLEERIHVACKEITTLEKQNKLLEEEEYEKREEEERRERKRLKEKERKLRRKEKLKGRERDKGKIKGDTKSVSTVGTECGSGAAISMDENEEVCSADRAKKNDMIDDLVARPSSPDMMEARSSADGVDFDNGTGGNHELSVSMDDVEDALSERDGNGAFIVEQSKAARRRSKMRKGPFMETVSRRLSRRSSLMALETGGPSRNSVQVASAPMMEMTEKVLQGPQRHCKASYKSDRSAGPRWIEGWNRRSQQRQNHQHRVFQNLESTFWLKTRQNETCRAGKDSFIIKKSERGNTMVTGSKHLYRLGNCVPGSLQYNWEIMKARGLTAGSIVKRGEIDHQPATYGRTLSETLKASEVSPPVTVTDTRDDANRSSSVGNFLMELRDPSKPLTTSGTCADVPSSAQLEIVSGSDESITWLARQNKHNDSTSVTDTALSSERAPKLLEPSENPVAELESFSQEASICRIELLSPGGLLDADLSPSSAASCVTDTSDVFTVDSMTTETASYLEGSSPLQEGKTAEYSPFLQSKPQDSHKEDVNNVDGYLEAKDLSTPVFKHTSFDNLTSKTTGEFPCSDLHSYPSTPDRMVHTHGFLHGHGQFFGQNGVNPGFSPMDMVPPACHVDSSVQIPVIPSSLLPLHPPQHIGYSWVQGQWATVPNAGLLPFPHPGSILLARPGGFGPSTGGPLLPLPAPFQPLPPVLGFSCLPTFPVDSNFAEWKESHTFSKVEGKIDGTGCGDVSGQHDSSYQETGGHVEELSLDFSTSRDTAQVLTSQLKDASGFSLFHFGGLAGAIEEEQEPSASAISEENTNESLSLSNMPCRSSRQQAVGKTKMNLPVEEYSLFAATPGNRFGFF